MSQKVNPLELYTIREATEADLPQILDIYNERVLNSTSLFVYDPVTLENRQTWLKDCQAKGYPVIVAVEKETNTVIAYSSLGQYRPHPAYVLTAEISIYININHHRRGLGRILLEEMIAIAEKMKLRSLIASITSENSPSIQLFGRYQFKQAGQFHDVGYKFGRFLDVTFLERILESTVVEFTGAASFTHFPWGQYRYGLE
ncbi:acyl-CoA N-acyltransferase [Halteromyces radiatus]|uniref:acyl-CoA N-acyltransferase n=1 Tax=Halteromyces radiatus TaxID=101107 RepID=UPI002220B11A|nr:acyl-CoA N-acyltransferase [Halteromyces radiatus]KAI8089907.1 acyl-CoA N-acyltransferase [Halteromyces radiatus]